MRGDGSKRHQEKGQLGPICLQLPGNTPVYGGALASQLLLLHTGFCSDSMLLPVNLRAVCVSQQLLSLKRAGISFSSCLPFSLGKAGHPLIPPKLYTVANRNSSKEKSGCCPQTWIPYFGENERKKSPGQVQYLLC